MTDLTYPRGGPPLVAITPDGREFAAVVIVDADGNPVASSCGSSGPTPDFPSERIWSANGMSCEEKRMMPDGSVQTRAITVRTAYQMADWLTVGGWAAAPTVLTDAILFNGQPLTLGGEIIVTH